MSVGRSVREWGTKVRYSIILGSTLDEAAHKGGRNYSRKENKKINDLEKAGNWPIFAQSAAYRLCLPVPPLAAEFSALLENVCISGWIAGRNNGVGAAGHELLRPLGGSSTGLDNSMAGPPLYGRRGSNGGAVSNAPDQRSDICICRWSRAGTGQANAKKNCTIFLRSARPAALMRRPSSRYPICSPSPRLRTGSSSEGLSVCFEEMLVSPLVPCRRIRGGALDITSVGYVEGTGLPSRPSASMKTIAVAIWIIKKSWLSGESSPQTLGFPGATLHLQKGARPIWPLLNDALGRCGGIIRTDGLV